MSDHFLNTIAALEEKLAEQMRPVNKTRSMINDLCEMAGLPPKYDISEGAENANGTRSRPIDSQIRSDDFFGKPLSTCIRKVLELRKAATGEGPTEVKEIYRLLKLGGYKFNTLDDANNLTGLGVSISKNSLIFVKLPNGLIGLVEWYPDMPKRRKDREDEQSEDSEPPAA